MGEIMKALLFAATLAAFVSSPTTAQDEFDVEEVIVTGSRITDYRPEEIPAVTLPKRADFMIQKVRVISDTRKSDVRKEEIYATIFKLMEKAEKSNIFTLGTGEDYFVPLTKSNFKLQLQAHRHKPDTSLTHLLVKAALDQKASANEISTSIKNFIKNAEIAGRTEVLPAGNLGLSIVRPEKYRKELIRKIAADARSAAEAFGSDYRITLKGLESPLQWERQGLDTMALFIPYEYDIVPVSGK